ncbi:MAG TPA: AAA family ATPase, partial [Caulobacteraceae bacterium]|nr:AAA family ATPase [Caulobacteraceae bacterium]
MHFPPIRWVVDAYIPTGFTLIAAKPKIGKSWLMLDIAVAVASGGYTLGDKHCVEGDVLYGALEDSQRRLKERMRKVIPHRGPWPRRLTLWTEMRPLEDGGLEQIEAWAKDAPDPRLIVIDTFAKVRSPKARDETAYEGDYRQGGALKGLSDRIGVAIIAVQHQRKMDADDPLDTVSGTTGLTGCADTILVMKREAAGVVLYGRGRDIEEIEIAMEFQRDICRWRVLGEAAEVRMSDERSTVFNAFRAAGGPVTAR